MFNERAVATRSIDAACRLRWPYGSFEVQVLDDSTDAEVRTKVDAAAAMWRSRGVRCEVVRRARRDGYKAGALEYGRKQTSAEFLALFDADFVPEPDFLLRTIPSFFGSDGEPLLDLALVQGQWAHLNALDSLLTLSQSLSLDDHHSAQMVWRSAIVGFVNFTGTAGVWRAAAIEHAGGWRAASLVEDCELSFRVLFAGYRTTFAEVPVPAELPASLSAYKAQQRRWTFGWAQLIRLHGAELLFGFRCPLLKKLHLCFHMCLSVQWPLWMAWQLAVPWLAYHKLLFYTYDHPGLLYMAPIFLHMTVSSIVACIALGRRYVAPLRQHGSAAGLLLAPLLLLRVVPAAVVAAGMLPHQCCAWVEGILTTAEAEFETTPKNGSVGTGNQDFFKADCGLTKACNRGVGGEPCNGSATAAQQVARRASPLALPGGAAAVEAAPSGRRALLPVSSIVESAYVAYHFIWCAVFFASGSSANAWRILWPAAAVICLWPTGETARQLADGLMMNSDRPTGVSVLPAPGGPTISKMYVLSQYHEPLLTASERHEDDTGTSHLDTAQTSTLATPVLIPSAVGAALGCAYDENATNV
mmetsp:Transcript_12695/g.38792  ORF Transcript_12695/g.38792 Transcript_12695/m.38792 type:complete len:585 (-) Transcript_12695:730-2484(-)